MNFKNWLKTFGLGFFSDSIAGGASKCGFAVIFVSLLLSFVFFMAGYYAADVVPFAKRYDDSKSFIGFIDGAFSDGDISFSIVDGRATSAKKINTFAVKEDADKYASNGYNLIVDTRASDTLIEFTQVAVKDGTEIGYEAFRELGDTEKKGYKIETRYTDRELEITDERIADYEAYLSGDDGAKDECAALDRSAADYARQLYYLYVGHYYESVGSVYGDSRVPVLRDYYYNNYVLGDRANYLYLFGDMVAGSFEAKSGIPVVFGGYFVKYPDGRVTDVHSFIKSVYYDTAGYSFSSYFVSSVSQLPLLIFIPMLLAAAMWLIGKAAKNCWEKNFSGCYKIIGAFVWFAAFLTAVITFICGFFVAARRLYMLMPAIFAAILVIRAVVYCIDGAIKSGKSQISEKQTAYDDIFGGII